MQVEKRYVVAPGEGKSIRLGGLGVDFKLGSEETGDLLSVVEHPIQPGVLVPPHMHSQEDEYSYVIDGVIGVRIGDREFEAGPGSYILKPRNVPHTFWNASREPARLIEIIVPGGFEKFFEELGEQAQHGPPDEGKRMELTDRYGVKNFMDWVPELTRKHGLTLFGGPPHRQSAMKEADGGYALAHGEGRWTWFLDALLTWKAVGADSAGQLEVVEQLGRRGFGPPLHHHKRESEAFYVLEGELTFQLGERRLRAGPGSFVFVPRTTAHAFVVESEQARFLTVVVPAALKPFLDELSRPAEAPVLPPEPAPLDLERFAQRRTGTAKWCWGRHWK